MNQMLGDVEMEGKLVTSQYFYNFTTNINLSLLHLPVSSKGGKQRHTQVYGPSPHTQWGKKKGKKTLKCKRPAQYMWAFQEEHRKWWVEGRWGRGLEVLTQVSVTQLRQWCPPMGQERGCCRSILLGVKLHSGRREKQWSQFLEETLWLVSGYRVHRMWTLILLTKQNKSITTQNNKNLPQTTAKLRGRFAGTQSYQSVLATHLVSLWLWKYHFFTNKLKIVPNSLSLKVFFFFLRQD